MRAGSRPYCCEIGWILVDHALHFERGQVAGDGADDAAVGVGLVRLDDLPFVADALQVRGLAVRVLDPDLLDRVGRELGERLRLRVGRRRVALGLDEIDIAADADRADQQDDGRPQPAHATASSTT